MYRKSIYLLPFFFFGLLVTSCDDESLETEAAVASTEETSNLRNSLMTYVSDEGSDESENYEEGEECFTFKFPITMVNPDGSTTTVNNEDELENYVKENESENFNLMFPVEIVLSDGLILEISDEGDLHEVLEDCFEKECKENYEEYADYDFQYPFEITLSDGTMLTIEDTVQFEEYAETVEDYDDINFVYPITLVDEEGNTLVANNIEELEEALNPEEEYSIEEESICFNIHFPITYNDTDGSTNEIADFKSLIEYFNSLDESEEEQSFNFPIAVTYYENEKETNITIENEEEFYALLESCYDNYIENIKHKKERCFEIQYPISATDWDGTTAEIGSHKEFKDFMRNNEEFDFNYPINVIQDNQNITINSDEDFDALFDSCY